MHTTTFSRLGLLGLLLLLLNLTSRTSLGQVISADSSQVSYEEEEETQSDFNLKERYNYLVRSKVEETRLWKLGLNDIGVDYGRIRYGVYLIYERKLRTSFSILGELNPTALPGYRFTNNPSVPYGLKKTRYLDLGAQISGRYYYNLTKRIRNGKSANNFSANYLSVSIKTKAAYLPKGSRYLGGYTSGPMEYFVEVPSYSVRYGLQRRLGRYGFIDGNLGLATDLLFLSRYSRQLYNWKSTAYGVGEFRIGLALGK